VTDELKIDRPVKGDVQYSNKSTVPQIGPAEFLAEIDRALAAPGVTGLVWEQYTPFFNDGDPCEFSLGEVRVLLDGVDENTEDDYDLEYERGVSDYDTYHSGGVYPWGGDLDAVNWVDFNGVSGRTVYELLRSLNAGSWENVALSNFGDHAVVTATPEGFSVDYYEHD
jgi:hypothetical protein